MRGGGWFTAVIAVAGLGFSIYQYIEGRQRAAAQEKKVNERTAKDVLKAKLMQRKQYNQELQRINAGRLMAESRVFEDQRKRVAKQSFYGTPVSKG